MIQQDNLVILREGVDVPIVETLNFQHNKFYRSIRLEEGSTTNTMVNGVIFGADFDKYFEFAHTKIMRDFQTIGLLKDNLKPLSKTAFKERIHIQEFSTKGLYRAFAYVHPKELLYSFDTPFKETKKSFLDAIYGYYVDVCNGIMDMVDQEFIKFGNSGIPITYYGRISMR